MLFGFGIEFFLAEHGENLHLLHDLTNVFHGVDNVSGPGFALGADHAGAFGDPAQSFAEVTRAANERDGEGVLVDVVGFVGWGEDFGFVDVIDAEFLQNLRLSEVADAALGHHGDVHGRHDLANYFGRSHASYAAFGTNLGGDTLQRHDRDGASLLGDFGLAGGSDIHDDAAFEHFGEAGFQAKAGGVSVVLRHKFSFLVTCSKSFLPFRALAMLNSGVPNISFGPSWVRWNPNRS